MKLAEILILLGRTEAEKDDFFFIHEIFRALRSFPNLNELGQHLLEYPISILRVANLFKSCIVPSPLVV